MKLAILGAGQTLHDIAVKLHGLKDFEVAVLGADASNLAAAAAMASFAKKSGIPFISRLSELDGLGFDAVLLHSYPPLITREYLDKHLFINTHYAPLPRFRGFHGLVWSIINGESHVAYTIHRVNEGIDSGPIYHQFRTPLLDSDDINTVMAKLDADLLERIPQILLDIASGQKPVPQDENQAIFVTRRKPEDGRISWSSASRDIHNLVRALTPPYTSGAFSHFKGKPLHIVSTELRTLPGYIGIPGKVVNIERGRGALIKTGDSALFVKEAVYEGKRINCGELFSQVGAQLY